MRKTEGDRPIQLTYIDRITEARTGEIVFFDLSGVEENYTETKVPEYIVNGLSEKSLKRLRENGETECWQNKF